MAGFFEGNVGWLEAFTNKDDDLCIGEGVGPGFIPLKIALSNFINPFGSLPGWLMYVGLLISSMGGCLFI